MPVILTQTHKTRLKRLALLAGAVVMFGAGYRFSALRGERVRAEEALKTAQNLTQKQAEAYRQGWVDGQAARDFDMLAVLPSGVLRSSVEAIDDQAFINPDSAKYVPLKMDTLTLADIKSADTLKDEKGRPLVKKWSVEQLQSEKHQLRRKNPANEDDLLADNAAYRNLLRLEMYHCTRYGQNLDLLVQDKAALERDIFVRTKQMQLKMELMEKYKNPGHYPVNAFWADYHRIRLAGAVLEERTLRESHNQLIDTLIKLRLPQRQAEFAAQKKLRLQALEDSVAQFREVQRDSFLYPFKYKQPRPSLMPLQWPAAGNVQGR